MNQNYRGEEICAACGCATGHAGYGDGSIGYCDGTIGPLCNECNDRLRMEVEADCGLHKQVEQLRDRLHAQTLQTQQAAKLCHARVLDEINRHGSVPEGIDPHGHPIEQIVGTVLAQKDLEIDRLRAEVARCHRELERESDAILRDEDDPAAHEDPHGDEAREYAEHTAREINRAMGVKE